MLQATRTSAIRYSFAFVAVCIAMSQIVHAIFEAKSLTKWTSTTKQQLYLVLSLLTREPSDF